MTKALTPVQPEPPTTASRAGSKVAPSSPYGISLEELKTINQEQMTEANLSELHKLGGVLKLAQLLCVNTDEGLPKTEMDAFFDVRRSLFGQNQFKDAPMTSLFRLFYESLQDTTLIILIIAAVASTITGYIDHPAYGWSEGIAILLGVLLVAIVTALNNYTKEKQFRALSAKNDDVLVKVIRNGKPDQVSVSDINVGEVVILETGDKVPADAVVIRSQDLKCNESSLTGEPEDVSKKTSGDPFLLSSCLVASGRCECLVIAVGAESRWGKIKSKLVREQKATPLMEKLETMAKHIGYIGTFFSLSTMIAMIIIYAVAPADSDKRKEYNWASYILHTFLIGVTIIVVAIPEGLPLAVTISLSYSTKKMLKDNNLIRVLAACETMGNVTSICSDKTGTLTENKMTVVEGWILGQHFTADFFKPKQETLPVDGKALRRLSSSVAVNTSAFLKEVNGLFLVQGNKTEGALLLWLEKAGFKYSDLRKSHFQPDRDRLFPFSSEKKTMCAIVNGEHNGEMILYCKGAAEVVLRRCTQFVDRDGRTVAINPVKRQELNQLILKMAENALRTICVAHRVFEAGVLPSDLQSLVDPPEDELVLDAIFGIMDPLRPDVGDAIRDCKRAGIMVRMVTGDNIHTAKAIARQCGIMYGDGVALEGPAFRTMSNDELQKVIPRLQVLARSSPDDKFKLVNLLKERGEVVGVTGDGTNDAPALRAADVGLAMGIAGTDLAKEASDIIIMDDRFSSIKRAVLWGRCVYDNIRKFLQFQLTVNIVALVVTFVSAVSGKEPPLNAVMMLWINLIMDTMGALALGTEAPTEILLDRRPYKRTTSLLSRQILKNIMFQSVFQLVLVFLLMIYGDVWFQVPAGNACVEHTYRLKSGAASTLSTKSCVTVSGAPCGSFNCTEYTLQNAALVDFPSGCVVQQCSRYDYRHYTIVFNAFVLSQVFNEFNARITSNDFNVFRGLSANPLFFVIIVVTIVVQILLAEFGGFFLKTSPIVWQHWLVCFGIGTLSFPVGLLMRLIPMKESADSFANPNNIGQG